MNQQNLTTQEVTIKCLTTHLLILIEKIKASLEVEDLPTLTWCILE